MTITEKQKEYEKVPTKELFNINEKSQVPTSFGYGIRHVQSLLLFVCMTVGYIARAHLGVSVVAMTNPKNNTVFLNVSATINENISINATDGLEFGINSTNIVFESDERETTMWNVTTRTINATDGLELGINNTNIVFESDEQETSMWYVFRTYDWPKSIQEMILDAFFLGYCLMMFPTGMVCQRFGGKLPLQICLLVNGLVSLATPTVAVWGGWKAVCGCRILQGLTQSGLYPSAHTLLSKWVPISERASLSSYVYTGTLIGTVLAFQIGGLMADSSAGWPGTFWLTGALCIGAFVLLTIFGAASPADHKTISDEEKNFIMGRIDDGKKKVSKMPWKHVFKSKHVWATFATHASAGICFVFLFTQIPTYMHYILGFDVKNSGLLSSLPYVASALATVGYGILSDYCTNRGIVTLRTARILCNTFAQAGPAICLVAVSFTDNSTLAVVLLIIALGLYAGIHSGWMVNYIDLAPNFGGSLMATGNTWATIGVLSQPILVSNIVTDVSNRYQWRIMMFLMAAMIFFSNALFVCFMSAETQPWNDINEQEDVETELTEKR